LSQYYSRNVFFDLAYSKEGDDELSKKNDSEVAFTFKLIKQILQICGNVGLANLKEKIGIITPYKG
jgi:AAA domain